MQSAPWWNRRSRTGRSRTRRSAAFWPKPKCRSTFIGARRNRSAPISLTRVCAGGVARPSVPLTRQVERAANDCDCLVRMPLRDPPQGHQQVADVRVRQFGGAVLAAEEHLASGAIIFREGAAPAQFESGPQASAFLFVDDRCCGEPPRKPPDPLTPEERRA